MEVQGYKHFASPRLGMRSNARSSSRTLCISPVHRCLSARALYTSAPAPRSSPATPYSSPRVVRFSSAVPDTSPHGSCFSPPASHASREPPCLGSLARYSSPRVACFSPLVSGSKPTQSGTVPLRPLSPPNHPERLMRRSGRLITGRGAPAETLKPSETGLNCQFPD